MKRLTTLLAVLGSLLLLTSLLSVAFAETTVTLAWDQQTPAPDGFLLFQRVNSGTYNYSAPVVVPNETDANGAIPGDVSSLPVPGLGVAGETNEYCWVLRAFIGSDQSGDSNEACYTVDEQIPAAPSISQSSFDRAASSITVGWTQDSSVLVTEWRVYYTLTSGQNYQLFDTVANDGSTTTPAITKPFTAVADGDRQMVYFVIVAVRSDQLYSQNSAEISVDVDRRNLVVPTLRVITIPVN